MASELRHIDHQLDSADLKLKLVEMMEALAKAQSDLVEAQAELDKKDAQIARLQSEAAFRSTKLVGRGQFRFFADDAGNPKGRPICPKCERRGEYLEVVQDRSRGAGRITYYCPGCNANYGQNVPRG